MNLTSIRYYMLDFVLSILHVILQSSKNTYELIFISHFIDYFIKSVQIYMQNSFSKIRPYLKFRKDIAILISSCSLLSY